MKSNLFLLSAITALIFVLFGASTWRLGDGFSVVKRGRALVPVDTAGAVFYDDFLKESMDRWLGDTGLFAPDNGVLGLVRHARSPAFVAIPSGHLRNTVWEVGVMAAGSLSATNYLRLYLAATTSSFQEAQWGYHLQIDGTEASHVYRLWRQNGLTRTPIFESNAIPNQQNTFHARIRVVCDTGGFWSIAVDEYDSGSFEILASKSGETSVKDDTYRSGQYSGYFVSFSPARWPDFELDYFLIKRLDQSTSPATSDIPQPGDILINEVLTNPKPGGVDFLEIYNYSGKAIDLSGVSVARVNANGTVGARQPITTHPLLFHPNEYKVLTRQPAIVKQHYPSAADQTMVEMAALPNFNNEVGGVVIYGQQGAIDSLFYTMEMQSPFMVSNRGVSLERQYFSSPTGTFGTFRSAAVTVGGATPGYQNSQYTHEPLKEEVFLTSDTFSPDHDGFEDQLEINYHLPESGFMANIDIYSANGRLVKRLVRHLSVATSGTIYWDGLSEGNIRPPVGMYIAVIEIYNAHGVRKTYRKGFALAARL